MFTDLDDKGLISQLEQTLGNERMARTDFLMALLETDNRSLWAKEGYGSLWSFCQLKLGLSESSTSKRIQAVKALRKFPKLEAFLRDGRIHLSGLTRLCPNLTETNFEKLTQMAVGLSTRAIEQRLAGFFPKPIPKDSVRVIEAPKPELPMPIYHPPLPTKKTLEWLTEDIVQVRFTASSRFNDKLNRAKEILKHQFPGGKAENVLEAALDALLDQKDPSRKKVKSRRVSTPKAESRRSSYSGG